MSDMNKKIFPLSVSVRNGIYLSAMRKNVIAGLFALMLMPVMVPTATAQVVPKVTVSVADTQKPADVAVALQIIFLITILTIAPSLLIMLTSFTRIIIAFSFLRRALGTQTMPPDQIMVGLALFMTLFIMWPVLTEMNEVSLQPYLKEEITFREGIDKAMTPVRNFMLRQVDEKDVALFVRVSRMAAPRSVDDLPMHVIIPAVYHQRTQDLVYYRLHSLYPVSRYRHGDIERALIDGDDDAAAGDDFAAVQDNPVCAD